MIKTYPDVSTFFEWIGEKYGLKERNASTKLAFLGKKSKKVTLFGLF
ncbi:hypothetical protein L4D09_22385 [Photobacterium makurazakiensis]